MNTQQAHRASCGCYSCLADHHAMVRQARAFVANAAPHWDSCEVRYRIQRAEAVSKISLCDELPAGWIVQQCVRVPIANGGGWTLIFEVQGAPRESDGTIVYRILQRLGAL